MKGNLSVAGSTVKAPMHKERDSNMELFRCFAMFLVVGVHANFWSLSEPTPVEAQQMPLAAFARFFFESVCIGSVNMFVLLSGWYGIRPKWSGFLKLVFQIFFCITLVYLLLVAAGLLPFSIGKLVNTFCLIGHGWFIRAYIGLYILAPVLNAFIEKASCRQLEAFLVAYFTFQLLYGWLFDSANFGGGYSTASFIFLYLLAHYLHVYRAAWIQHPRRSFYLAAFLMVALAQGGIALGLQRYNHSWAFGKLFIYTNPAVILMSLSMLLYFSRLKFHSRFVNWVAASAFSVYLLHCCLEFTAAKFKMAVQYLYASFSGVPCILAIVAFVIAVYAVATLFDKLRIACWNILTRHFERLR